jgi:hypothetical protein
MEASFPISRNGVWHIQTSCYSPNGRQTLSRAAGAPCQSCHRKAPRVPGSSGTPQPPPRIRATPSFFPHFSGQLRSYTTASAPHCRWWSWRPFPLALPSKFLLTAMIDPPWSFLCRQPPARPPKRHHATSTTTATTSPIKRVLWSLAPQNGVAATSSLSGCPRFAASSQVAAPGRSGRCNSAAMARDWPLHWEESGPSRWARPRPRQATRPIGWPVCRPYLARWLNLECPFCLFLLKF